MYNNLYHFTSIDSLMKILISNEIRLNNIKNVNDIDEFSDLETEIETSTTAIKQKRDLINQKNILEEFIKTQKDFNIQQIKSLHTNVDLDSFSLSKTTKAFKEIKETESIINANEQKIKKIKKDIAKIAQSKNTNRIMNLDVRKFLYLTCFTYLSKEDENPIKQIINKTTMWGHYADKHKGVCLILNKEKILNLFHNEFSNIPNCIFKKNLIKYFELQHLSSLRENKLKSISLEDKIDIYFYKACDWKVEDEFRLLVYKECSNQFILLKNIRSAIEGFIFGARTSNDDINLITQTINCIGIDNLSIQNNIFGFKASRYNYDKTQKLFLNEHLNYQQTNETYINTLLKKYNI